MCLSMARSSNYRGLFRARFEVLGFALKARMFPRLESVSGANQRFQF